MITLLNGLFFDDSTATSADYDLATSCINRANSSAQVTQIEADIAHLNSTWNPAGFFRPSDVAAVLATLADQVQAVGAAIMGAPDSTADSYESKHQAVDDVQAAYSGPSHVYANAVNTARSSAADAISAPGFKSFVLATMRAIANGYVVAAVLQCQQSWLESILDHAYSGIAAIGAAVVSMAEVAVDAATNVVHAAETLGKVLVFLAKWAPYAAVGVGGFLLYMLAQGQYRKHGFRGFLPKRLQPPQ